MASIKQEYIRAPGVPSNVSYRKFTRRHAGEAAKLINQESPSVVGVSVQLSAAGVVELVALATCTNIYLIEAQEEGHSSLIPLDGLFKTLLIGSSVTLVGFGMAKIAVQVYHAFRFRIRGVDLSTLFAPSTNTPLRPSEVVKRKLHPKADGHAIDKLWSDYLERRTNDYVCLQAWITARAAENCIEDMKAVLRVDTKHVRHEELTCLANLLIEAHVLQEAKPREIMNDFTGMKITGEGVQLQNARYKNRIRRSQQTEVIFTNSDGQEFTGRAKSVRGKTTGIKLRQGTLSGTITTVRVAGREAQTNAERSQDEFILFILRGERSMREYHFIRALWFPPCDRLPEPLADHDISLPIGCLNESQRLVVLAMVSTEEPLVITHGPPGTGKTTTIAHAVHIWEQNNYPVWIVAHSNVAVKNIAESLSKLNIDFKLIVSQEFYVEWHEHIYALIQERLIRSDEIPKEPGDLARMLGTSNVILCTLSMLSNPILKDCGIDKLVPLERLVIDEASQINVFDYLHIFGKSKDLQKVCFFGDPRQLPPFGQNDAPHLQSIFDIQSLQNNVYFLNKQYRMPEPLGDFISNHVYERRLCSEHKIKSVSCVSFVDVTYGSENKSGSGYSWMNMEEVRTIVHLVQHYYGKHNFCVITPYDAQRAAIEQQLKAENLPWEHVFNVDSFQGNEKDYVLVSAVRTASPGFLTSRSRLNVLLTRCKVGMVIVTNRVFLRTTGKDTLLGKLSRHWCKLRGEATAWVDWKLVAERRAELPGMPPPRRVDLPTAYSISYTYQNSEVPGLDPAQQREEDIRRRSTFEREFPSLGGPSKINLPVQGRWQATDGLRSSFKMNKSSLLTGTSIQDTRTEFSHQVQKDRRIGTRQNSVPVQDEISPSITYSWGEIVNENLSPAYLSRSTRPMPGFSKPTSSFAIPIIDDKTDFPTFGGPTKNDLSVQGRWWATGGLRSSLKANKTPSLTSDSIQSSRTEPSQQAEKDRRIETRQNSVRVQDGISPSSSFLYNWGETVNGNSFSMPTYVSHSNWFTPEFSKPEGSIPTTLDLDDEEAFPSLGATDEKLTKQGKPVRKNGFEVTTQGKSNASLPSPRAVVPTSSMVNADGKRIVGSGKREKKKKIILDIFG